MNAPHDALPGDFRFHHMGLLTGNADRAAAFLALLGYDLADPVTDPLQKATLRMARGRMGNPDVEIISPMPDNQGLLRLLKRRDDYIYHLCYVVPDLAAAGDALTAFDETAMQATPPTPAALFEGRRVAFYIIAGIGLIELVEAKCSVRETL